MGGLRKDEVRSWNMSPHEKVMAVDDMMAKSTKVSQEKLKAWREKDRKDCVEVFKNNPRVCRWRISLAVPKAGKIICNGEVVDIYIVKLQYTQATYHPSEYELRIVLK